MLYDMIVPTMTQSEIFEEIVMDIPNVLEVSDNKNNKIRRLVRKASVFPLRLHSFVTTKRKNRWLLSWEAHNRRNIDDNILFTMACIAENENGKMVFMPSCTDGENITFFVFLPHFFSRFAERMNLNLTGEELIRRYLQYNFNFSISTEVEWKSDTVYNIKAVATSSEGAAFGYQLKGIGFFFKTFITFDMAQGEQIEDFAEKEASRKRIHDEFLKNNGLWKSIY